MKGGESHLLLSGREATAPAPMESSRSLLGVGRKGGARLFPFPLLVPVGSELSNYLVYLLLLEVNDWWDRGCCY